MQKSPPIATTSGMGPVPAVTVGAPVDGATDIGAADGPADGTTDGAAVGETDGIGVLMTSELGTALTVGEEVDGADEGDSDPIDGADEGDSDPIGGIVDPSGTQSVPFVLQS